MILDCDREKCLNVTRSVYEILFWSELKQPMVLHGTFGGPEGWVATQNELMCNGQYIIPNENGPNDLISFYSECPLKRAQVINNNGKLLKSIQMTVTISFFRS